MTVHSVPRQATARRHETRLLIKRLLDLAASSAGLVISLPFLVIGMIAIRLTMGPGVIFRQARPGRLGRSFILYKLRTMLNEQDSSGNPRTDFARVTAVGRLLRTTCIDELPQLWNVLKGDMSLVGPRPLLTKYLERYDEFQMRRHEVKPGITGWAQIHRREAVTWQNRLELDVWYVDHWTLWLDFRILTRTVLDVFSSHGNPAMDSLSRTTDQETEFKGNSGVTGLASAAAPKSAATAQERL
jgi:sugar transferase EpsL